MNNFYKLLAGLLLGLALPAAGQDINELIHKEALKSVTDAGQMYRDLHQNPELSLQEFRTAAKMSQALKAMGFEVTTGVGGNGVVGVFRNGEGPVIMFRTDMDALPVKEATGLPWASKVVSSDSQGVETPVMHACGHDFHMTVWHGTLSALVTRATASMGSIIGRENVIRVEPATVAEDFGKYGRTPEKVKIALFWLGGVNQEKYRESMKKGTMLPALHSSNFAPDFEPAYITGVTAMSRTIIDLLARK